MDPLSAALIKCEHLSEKVRRVVLLLHSYNAQADDRCASDAKSARVLRVKMDELQSTMQKLSAQVAIVQQATNVRATQLEASAAQDPLAKASYTHFKI